MSTTTLERTDYAKAVGAINDLMIKGMEAWKEAGRIVADLVDRDPCAIDQLIESSPMLTKGILRSLERIGRCELVPELLLKGGAAYAKLRELPYPVQQKYLKEPVQLMIQTSTGVDTLNVALDSLSPAQVRQVFSADGVRSLPEQRAWLAEHSRPVPAEAEALPYEVHGKIVVFTRPCKLSRADLQSLIQRI
jgi:hypothetical protein